jgi:proteasome lid subunit RPN8/RPN11
MQVPAEARDAMVAHARFEFPNEACGLFAVDEAGRLRMVYCLTNAQASPTRYTLDSREHFKAMRHAEGLGWEIGGVFHSHTHSAAYPSPTDVSLALEPEWTYVIVGLGGPDPDVRGFRINAGTIDEVLLDVSNSAQRNEEM